MRRSALAIAGVLVCAVFALLLIDLLGAATAQPCPEGPDCYPWGAEGPAAGRWSYESKANYLIRGGAQLALIAGAGILLMARPGGARPMSATVGTVAFAALLGAGLLFLV